MRASAFLLLVATIGVAASPGAAARLGAAGVRPARPAIAAPPSARPATTTASRHGGPADLDTTRLRRAIDSLQRHAGGRLGVGVELLETGTRVVAGARERFPMQSVYKLPVAMAALAAVDRGALALEQRVRVTPADYVGPQQHSPVRDAHPAGTTLTVRELLRLNTAESDGSACDVLFRLLGGPRRVRAWLRDVGVTDIEVRSTEREIGSAPGVQYANWATPSGALTLLRAVHTNRAAPGARGWRADPLLADSSRALLLRWLVETPTGPRRLRGRLPSGTVVAHKTGSSRTVDGMTAATNDIGIITLPDGRHLAVAVFLADSRLDDVGRDAVIAGVARAAWDAAWDAAAGRQAPR